MLAPCIYISLEILFQAFATESISIASLSIELL